MCGSWSRCQCHVFYINLAYKKYTLLCVSCKYFVSKYNFKMIGLYKQKLWTILTVTKSNPCLFFFTSNWKQFSSNSNGQLHNNESFNSIESISIIAIFTCILCWTIIHNINYIILASHKYHYKIHALKITSKYQYDK